MKVQKHINASPETKWCRCSRAELSDGIVTWELSRTGEYDLLAAYQRRPHLQLAQATDDKALVAFVKAWGPLRQVILLDSTKGTDPVDDYRTQRDLLSAEIRLIASISHPAMQRPALMEVIAALAKRDYSDAPLVGLRHHFGIPRDKRSGLAPALQQWTERASVQELRAACAYLISFLPITDYSLKLRVDQSRRGDTVRAWPGLTCLVDALHWMVWQDVYRARPFLFCDECDSLFQPDSEHEKKFCSTQCARRKASREYERRKRAKEKKNDGTQKAR
jgi:hypothetical protein